MATQSASEEEIVIPVGDAEEIDSAYGDDAFSDTTSIATTIKNHRYEHGRRYHKYKEGEYWGPNDDIQNDQLDIAHHMLRLLLDDKLYLAPIGDSPQNVLDVGCGTGIWTIDFADEHPTAEVIGVDLSPTQPEFVPSNVKFELDDVTQEWTFPPNHFDFIHIRCMFGTIRDWPALYKEVYNALTPGGWIQELEMDIQFKSDDGTCGPDHIMYQWSQVFIEAGEKWGKTFKIPHTMKGMIADAGFTEVTQVKYKLPVGGWSSDPKLKELGKWNLLHCYQGAEGWALFLLTHVMGWTIEETKVYIAKFKAALKEKNTHAYYEIVAVYARKPLDASA